MTPKKQIDTLMMPMRSYWLTFLGVIVISLLILSLCVFFALKNHNDFIFIFGGLLAILPTMIIRQKINLIAKKATIIFSEEFIKITTSGTLNDSFLYSDIKYFSVSKIAGDYASRINFILRSDAKRRYIFFRQLDNDENVLNNVLFYFSSYNVGKTQEEKIQMSPSFFLTRGGRLLVAACGILILTVIAIQLVYKPKTIPISLLAVLGGYLQAKAIQINDKKILKKFLDENQ